MAFRSLSVIDKTVETCVLEMEPDQSRIKVGCRRCCHFYAIFSFPQVRLHCKHQICKTFHLGFVECETLRAVYDNSGNSPNSWTVQSKVLEEANKNFLANQEEVTMTVAQDSFR